MPSLPSGAMHICTVVARNYLASARVLAQSFLAHNPEGTCWTLVIDDVDREVDSDSEPFRVVAPEQLDIDLWDQMIAGYDVLELSTAVKPWLLRYLLGQPEIERIAYLDPDIHVFASLRELDELLREHALVVTPHLTAPMPRDGRKPAETDILISGSFNLGFAGFAAGEQVDALLNWWGERLATDCLVAPDRGYFVDQRWMDLVPGLISNLFVLRDPGYNVAYWNLPSRDLRRTNDAYEVNGRPLRFFHFSGYDPARPDQLSKHQDRIELDKHPIARELCDGYARALAAEGHEQWRLRPYAWGALPDGSPLDAAARSVYRQAVKAGVLTQESIFTETGGGAFATFLRSPADNGGEQGVTRYLDGLRATRADLRDAFADLNGADGARLVAWAKLSADEVPQGLVASESAETPSHCGVNVIGYFKGVMGVGEHARQLAQALRTQEIAVRTTIIHPEAAPEDDQLIDDGLTGTGRESRVFFNLLCANAESVPGVVSRLGDEALGERYTIGFWAWEVSTFPERYMSAFADVDEVWVGSRHVRDAVAELATVPVLVIPQPVSLSTGFATAPAPAGLPEGFRFLFAFDYLSVFERKNPLATIDAFGRAFAPGSGAVLIIKTVNDEHDPTAHERVHAAAAAHPDVYVIEERLSASERDSLLNAADCYVSLHRAEGFGYTLAESMWAGKPVIATGYSGNVDYMTPANSYLVDYRLVPIGPGHDPYPGGGVWAEPDLDHAAALMREVFDDPAEGARRGQLAAADIRSGHSPQVAGRFMVERLKRLLASPGWHSANSRHRRPRPLDTGWVEGLIHSGPVPPARPRFGSAQRAVRKGLLRLLKPVTVHERLVDGGLLKAIERLDANVRSLAQSQDAAFRRIEELQGNVQELLRRSRSDE